MFSTVIVRRPSKSLVNGITSAPELGKPDYTLALKQHDNYINALSKCDVEVVVLEALEEYPDSCFVEDTAVLTPKCAIVSNPGAVSRRGEAMLMATTIEKFYESEQIEYIKSPATMEGGDVMMVGNHFYIGESERSNKEGCDEFIKALEKYGHTCSVVTMKEMLHLKTGMAYLENNNILLFGEFIDKVEFSSMNKIIISESESYSANCIWVNDRILIPLGYSKTTSAIQSLGYETIIVDTSEYRKLDGGLSCLSLRF